METYFSQFWRLDVQESWVSGESPLPGLHCLSRAPVPGWEGDEGEGDGGGGEAEECSPASLLIRTRVPS